MLTKPMSKVDLIWAIHANRTLRSLPSSERVQWILDHQEEFQDMATRCNAEAFNYAQKVMKKLKLI